MNTTTAGSIFLPANEKNIIDEIISVKLFPKYIVNKTIITINTNTILSIRALGSVAKNFCLVNAEASPLTSKSYLSKKDFSTQKL